MASSSITLLSLSVLYIIICISSPYAYASISLPQATSEVFPQIDFQIHSFDDLREWPQLMHKWTHGPRYMKIDVNYQPASFCSSQTAFQPNVDPRGCFVLIHDNPVTSRQYNNMNDVISFITDPANQWVTQDPNSPLYFALCFKLGHDPCDGSPLATNWTSLVDDLFTECNSVVEKFDLNIEWVLDGSASPKNCLAQKWRPWTSTYIKPGDPLDALFSNNASLGYDRYQWLNEMAAPTPYPEAILEAVELVHYGKFLSSSPYPFLFWEPSNQYDILRVSKFYMGHSHHAPGFRFAINIDPVQFQVFSAQQSGLGWNYQLPRVLEQSSEPINMSMPSIVSLVSSASASSSSLSFLSVSLDTDITSPCASFIYSFLESENGVLGPISSISSLTWNTLSTPDSICFAPHKQLAGLTLLSKTENLVLFVDTSSQFIVYSADMSQSSLQNVSYGLLQTQGESSSSTLSVSSFFLGSDSYILQTSQTKDCPLFLQVWSVSTATGSLEFTSVGFGSCVQPQGGNPIDASASVAAITGPVNDDLCGDIGTPTHSGALFYSTAANLVYGAVICVDVNSGLVRYIRGRVSDDEDGLELSLPLDVGTAPSLSFAEVDGHTVAMLLVGDSYCYNCEFRNKRPTPAVCDQVPTSIPNVLSYTYGTLESLQQTILDNKYITPCSPHVLHGIYDQGKRPWAHLFTCYDSIGIAAIHEGITASEAAQDNSDCGTALAYTNGLVLDSWPLPNVLLSPFSKINQRILT